MNKEYLDKQNLLIFLSGLKDSSYGKDGKITEEKSDWYNSIIEDIKRFKTISNFFTEQDMNDYSTWKIPVDNYNEGVRHTGLGLYCDDSIKGWLHYKEFNVFIITQDHTNQTYYREKL